MNKTYTFTIALSALAIVVATAEVTLRHPFKLDLKQRGGFNTLVGFEGNGPPPWQDGNCITIGKWFVLNMHAEQHDGRIDLHGDQVESQVSYRRVAAPKEP